MLASTVSTATASGNLNYSMNGSSNNLANVPQILFLILLGVLTSVGAPPPPPFTTPATPFGKSRCSFNGQEYAIGETWFRHLKTPTTNFCVNCLCKDDGRVNCSTVKCSADMCSKEDAKDCSQETLQSKDVITSSADSSASTSVCSHNGHLYENGQSFTSNATGQQAPVQPNQCVQCLCQNGLVVCKIRNCTKTPCRKAQFLQTDCCSPCDQDEETEHYHQAQMDSSSVTILANDRAGRNGDCFTAGGVSYSHGSSWHPVIGPFGPMDCVFCKCQDGKIECKRLNCSNQRDQPCLKQVQVPGQCCPVCLEEGQRYPSGSGSVRPTRRQQTPSVTLEQKGHTNHKERPYREGSGGGSGRREKTEGSECLPMSTDTVVYRSHASSTTSSYYQYAFQIMENNRNTRLLTWTIKDGRIGDFSEQHLSRSEFETLTRTFKFKIQGATRIKFMEKFIRKAKRLPERCNSRCAVKIQRLEQVLHLREITKKPNCDSGDFLF